MINLSSDKVIKCISYLVGAVEDRYVFFLDNVTEVTWV